MPFQIIGIWLRGLLSIALIGLAAYLLREWHQRATTVSVPAATSVESRRPEPAGNGPVAVDRPEPVVMRTRTVPLSAWRPGWDIPTAMLAGGLLLAGLSAGGGSLAYPLLRRKGADEPNSDRGGVVERIRRPDGSELHVEMYGPADGQPLVLVHGWGSDATEWYYLKKQLGNRFRLITWDLPGLGLSKGPDNNDYSLDKLAQDLDAVISRTANGPVVILGHSIGGMTCLTYCRLFADTLSAKVAGMILVHTTPTNPVRTTQYAGLYTALQKPLIEPLLYLTIGLAPVVLLMNWLSYLNGSLQRSTAKSSFAGNETRGQVDFVAKYMLKAWPAVLARGMFGMLAYDASKTLKTIEIPTLIVSGDRDTTTLPDASEWMRLEIPRARLFALAPARHMGLIEMNDQFADAVAGFVVPLSPKVQSATAAGRASS
jgi:pimeloyl-ACP methyl ester carboxylesterase